MLQVSVIDHNKQRYNTVGDWYYDSSENSIIVKVSDTRNNRLNFLIAIHEIIEATLCMWDGITSKMVDKWDSNNADYNDPGSLPNCIYGKQHLIATSIEMMLAVIIGVDWNWYEDVINSLSYNYKTKKGEVE